MKKGNNMFVYYIIHKIASSYQSKRIIKVYIVVWKVWNKPFSQNLAFMIFEKILRR